jgi:23S rRNA (guanosine2251-2'-O)-methyltransferase
MTTAGYEIRQCLECGLRYPLVDDHAFGNQCPLCRSETRLILRRELVTGPHPDASPGQVPTLEALLDNIRSAWNVGSIFRSADGLGIRKLHLCGITPTPEYSGVGKTALGAEQTIPWTYYRNVLVAAEALKEQGKQLWALEHDPRALSINDVLDMNINIRDEIVLIVGNEITGVDPEVLDLCERIIFIPMDGSKRSLNVAVAFGIAANSLRMLERASDQ